MIAMEESSAVVQIKKRNATFEYAPSENGVLYFAHVSDDLIRASGFFTCREYVTSAFTLALHNNLVKDVTSVYHPGIDSPISRDCLRLLLYKSLKLKKNRKLFTDRLYNAVEGIRRFEEHMGWGKSTIHKAALEDYCGLTYVVTASNKWILQPQLLSIYTLFLRFFSNTDVDTSSIGSIYESVMALISKYDKKLNHNPDLEVFFISDGGNQILKYALFLDKFEILFKGLTMEKSWPKIESNNDFGRFRAKNGITSFIRKVSDYSKEIGPIQEKFAEMCKAEKIC